MALDAKPKKKKKYSDSREARKNFRALTSSEKND